MCCIWLSSDRGRTYPRADSFRFEILCLQEFDGKLCVIAWSILLWSVDRSVVVMVRMLSGDRGHVKKVQEKGIVAKQALAKSCKKAFFLCT